MIDGLLDMAECIRVKTAHFGSTFLAMLCFKTAESFEKFWELFYVNGQKIRYKKIFAEALNRYEKLEEES